MSTSHLRGDPENVAQSTTATNNPANEARDPKDQKRRLKSTNSTLFNEILSRCNQLSVQERTRLVKSLCGQLGLLAVGGNSLISETHKATDNKKSAIPAKQEFVRPNPLKGTKFEMDKEAAKAAMLKAKEDANGAQLPDNHPAVTAYRNALTSYKAEQAKLQPVEGAEAATTTGASSKKQAKRKADKSPVRSLSGRAVGHAKRLLGAGSKSTMDLE